MNSGYIHSVKVPQLYKLSAKIVSKVTEEGASLKQLIYEKKHPNIKAVYALAFSTLKYNEQLDFIIDKAKILSDNERLDPWLAKILITELLWGKKKLPAGSKPIDTVLSYEKQLRKEATFFSKEQLAVINTEQVKKPRYVRVNTLKTTIEQTISDLAGEGWQCIKVNNNYNEYLKALDSLQPQTFLQDIHVPELFVFPPGTMFYDHFGYKNGHIVLQDKASCLPSVLLNPSPGSTVLDMCAAPGMKTTHIAAIMNNQGQIYAVEQNVNRYKTLKDMVTKMNCTCVKTILNDSLMLGDEDCPNVEYVLVDPSCSGSGMVDRPVTKNDKAITSERLKNLQSFQIMMLTHALLNFSKVKRVVYSTCSVYPEENEQVVDEVLDKIGNAYELVKISKLLNKQWINYSSKDYKCKKKCLYAKSDIDKTNGFFVAVFDRNEEIPLPAYSRTNKKSTTDFKKGQNNKDIEIKTFKKMVNVGITNKTNSETEYNKTNKEKKKNKKNKKRVETNDVNSDFDNNTENAKSKNNDETQDTNSEDKNDTKRADKLKTSSNKRKRKNKTEVLKENEANSDIQISNSKPIKKKKKQIIE